MSIQPLLSSCVPPFGRYACNFVRSARRFNQVSFKRDDYLLAFLMVCSALYLYRTSIRFITVVGFLDIIELFQPSTVRSPPDPTQAQPADLRNLRIDDLHPLDYRKEYLGLDFATLGHVSPRASGKKNQSP